jgi:hypothetical protein
MAKILVKANPGCSFNPCINRVDSLKTGLCAGHIYQLKRGNELKVLGNYHRKKEYINKDKTCSFNPCENEANARGLCATHNFQKIKGKPLTPVVKKEKSSKNKGRFCFYEGCEKEAAIREMCIAHYSQAKRGRPLAPLHTTYGRPRKSKTLKESNWIEDKQGYVYRFAPADERNEKKIFGKKIAQHREVMEEHVGRALLPHETVHHKNGVRNDNRIENLELWSGFHPSGQRVVDKLAWAYEIIETYEKNYLEGKI